MAVYRCEIKRISRSNGLKPGRSSVAAAAYRTATRMRNQRDGVEHDYRRRAAGVAYAETLAPSHAPEWAQQRFRLWNEVEVAERRKDANTAREILVSLPHELDDRQRAELVRGFASRLIERYGVAVDLAIHRPDRQGDERNHHAHLMMTSRRMTREGLGEKTRELDDRKTGPQEVEAIRMLWEQSQNLALERAGVKERVSRLSNKARGINREPQQKVAEKLTAFARKGIAPAKLGTWQEVVNRRNTRKARQRHRLERQSLARRYQREADSKAMLANAARVMKMRDAEQVANSPMRENMRRQRERKSATEAMRAAQMSGRLSEKPAAQAFNENGQDRQRFDPDGQLDQAVAETLKRLRARPSDMNNEP